MNDDEPIDWLVPIIIVMILAAGWSIALLFF